MCMSWDDISMLIYNIFVLYPLIIVKSVQINYIHDIKDCKISTSSIVLLLCLLGYPVSIRQCAASLNIAGTRGMISNHNSKHKLHTDISNSFSEKKNIIYTLSYHSLCISYTYQHLFIYCVIKFLQNDKLDITIYVMR